MAAQTQIGIRLPADLLVAIDAVVADKQRPGVEYTRSDAIRELLYSALKPITIGVRIGDLEPVMLEARTESKEGADG